MENKEIMLEEIQDGALLLWCGVPCIIAEVTENSFMTISLKDFLKSIPHTLGEQTLSLLRHCTLEEARAYIGGREKELKLEVQKKKKEWEDEEKDFDIYHTMVVLFLQEAKKKVAVPQEAV
jgi:hypothetical protein